MHLGNRAGQPQAAAAVVKTYLAVRRDVAPAILLRSAETAEMAGDLRSAVVRYKQYLKQVPPGADTSAETLRLYFLLVDGMGATDDAYRLMTEMGNAARASLPLKRYDGWYLAEARRRSDVPSVARRLAAVMADQQPLEMERLVCWDHLKWLDRTLSEARPEYFPALPDCRRIAGMIRENDVWSKSFGFMTANLAFHAGAAGKDVATLDREFGAVAAAARAYVDAAPTAETVRDIYWTFAGGLNRFDGNIFNAQREVKASLFPYAFGKMNDKERANILGSAPNWYPQHWIGAFTTRERYGELLAAFPDLFRKSPASEWIPLVNDSTNPAVYKALAPFAQGVPSGDALVVTALGSHDDLSACWQRVIQDSWFLPSFIHVGLNDVIWNLFARFPRDEARKLPGDARERALFRFGTDVLAKTPVFLFDVELARRYLACAWNYSGADSADKTRFAESLRLFDWIPYADREAVFGGVNRQFRSWAEQSRNQQGECKGRADAAVQALDAARKQREDEAKKPNANLQALDARLADLTKALDARKADLAKADTAAALISALEAEFSKALDPKIVDPAKAPNDLCRNLARAVLAVSDRNLAAYQDAARAAYAAVRAYPAQKTPFGRATVRFLMQNRLDAFDTIDFQCEVLADQIALGSPESGNRAAAEAYGQIGEGRPSWDKANLLKLNAALAKGLRDLFARNQHSPTVFDWFRGVRKLAQAMDADLDILETLLTRKELLADNPDRVVLLMSLVRNEFPKLAEKYPLETWFDAAFVENARQRRYVDRLYFEYGGRDEKGLVLQAMAEIFQGYDRLPFGYDGGTVVYNNQDWFWDLQSRAMRAPPAVRDAMLARIESCFGKTRFDVYANGAMRMAMLSIGGPADRKRFFDSLNAWVAAREQEPVRAATQPPLSPLAVLRGADLTDSELNGLIRLVQLGPTWNLGWLGDLDRLVYEGLMARQRSRELFALAPSLWGIARSPWGEGLRVRVAGYANAMAAAGLTDLAASYAAAGIEIIGAGFKEEQRDAMLALKAKALSGVLSVVAVDRADRRFPLLKAQADYQMGKFEEAWQGYAGNRALFAQAYRELDPAFSIWLIGRLTDTANFTEAESAARLMIQWVDQATQSFDPEDRARLLLAYAQIAFARQEYPRASAICEQVASAKEFEETSARHDADLKIAEIERLTKRYDKAIERLERMLRQPDAYVQAEANYGLALVKFDQEEYPESRSYVGKVLAISPSHPSARILEGKLNLKMKKLVEATEVRVGLSASQQTMLPGKPLKISLEDPSLSIVGKSVNIEIKAWTDSGDEELFLLLPFGDSKTKFEGSIPTALGETRKGDRTLQVLGGDVVRYDFSDTFKRANKIAGREPVSIRVIADGELFVSSGRIASKDEQEQRRLDDLIRARLKAESAIENAVALSTIRADDEVKPGNQINVRVVDPDESVSTNKDTVSVKVTTSSGDRIARVPLVETGPYSGVFEGYIQTASAQATAFASDSDEGKDPNFAITGAEYPPWVALPDNRRPKSFSVDLNNNCALGAMKIASDVPGRKLKKFILQTASRGSNFVAVCAWPENLKAWTGAGLMEVVRYADATRPPASLRDFLEYLDVGHAVAGCEKISVVPPPLDVAWDNTVSGLGDRLRLAMEGANSWYLGHVQLAFYQDARQKRTFRLAPLDLGAARGSDLIVTLNGAVGRHPREVTQSLGKGMHRLDIYFAATRKAGIRFWLETDTTGPVPQAVKCTPEMFTTPANVDARELQAIAFQPAAITSAADNGLFTVTFNSNTVARAIRLWMLDFEADAPAIRKIALADSAGKAILPTAQDVVKLRENDLLEIVPGDRVTVSYEDPNFLNKERRFSEAFMNVTYNNATLSACFIESEPDSRGIRTARYIPMRRFKPGDAVNVIIRDPDCDTTDQPDVVKLRAAVGERSVVVDALETEVHSGSFLARIFPVTNGPQRASEIQIRPGEDLTLSYLDAENTDPGIPWNRTCTLEQIYYSTPEIRTYEYASRLLTDREAADIQSRQESAKQTKPTEEFVPPRRSIAVVRPEAVTNAGSRVLLGCPLVVEITHPEMAQSPISRAAIFVQTLSGRKAYGKPPEGEFDINVPGTVKVEAPPNDRVSIQPPPGYSDVTVPALAAEENALDEGRFTFVVPVKPGATPARSLVDAKPEGRPALTRATAANADSDWEEVKISVTAFNESGKPQGMSQTLMAPVLRVRGDDTLFVGYAYRDKDGSNRWMTASATLASDPFLDVMDRRYREAVTNLHVGETLYLRLIHPSLDRSDEKDSASVRIRSSSGQTETLTLSETLGHSGVFKGLSQVVYTGDPTASNAAAAVRVNYGDTLDLAYAPPDVTQALTRTVAVYKGDDGVVLPFTKRFKEPSIAVQTQFTVAEAYFEMAKKHREIGQEELARREIGQGKKLLEEAIRDYPHTEARAQAEYLLADLALEFGGQVQNPEQKTKYYLEAVSRFTEIVASYPDSPYAPKGQFKKALTYEKMGRIDEACEEYVKLSYRYPDNELVAETIARLGQYFLAKGKSYEEKMKAQTDPVARERTRMDAFEMYKTAAQVFGRLSPRFPDHRLAGKTLVLSGQCYMRAEDYPRAIEVFKGVVEAKKAEPDLIAETMYWCGDSYMKATGGVGGDPVVEAYRMFKKLTWDYPETVWAKYARGRLTEPALARADEEAAK
ncbi:MAG: tetratricopeptide repeat protein [Lentisphaerae bacterium]|nr:tetratricopeptide repeat protein [Lentisphaerota bacterium]